MKTCHHCDSPSAMKQGNSYRCARHGRLHAMRYIAKKRGKVVPAFEWLEANVPVDMVCPCCTRQMNWLAKEGYSTAISLQHDRDGGMRLICMGCNVRHAHMPDDSFYELAPGTKRCHYCGETKPDAEFVFHGLCRLCRPLKFKAWARANPEKLKAKDAAWRAANPDKVKAIEARNYEIRKARGAAWRAANPEEAKAKGAKMYAAHKAWSAANPEEAKAKWARAYAVRKERIKAQREARAKAQPNQPNQP